MPPNYFIFLKIYFEYNAHIPAFHKRHSFIWGCSFSVSILVSLIKTFLLLSCDWNIISEIKKWLLKRLSCLVKISFVVIEFFYRYYSAYNFFPANLDVNNGNIRTMCEICSKLTFVLVSLLLTLNRFHKSFWCFHYWPSTSKCWLGFFFCFHYFITDLQSYEIIAVQNTSVFYFFS